MKKTIRTGRITINNTTAKGKAPRLNKARVRAIQLRMKWRMMPEAEQIVFIQKCIWKVAKIEGLNPHNLHGLEFDDYVNETWIIITQRFRNMKPLVKKIRKRQANGKKNLSLVTQICHCVRAAFMRGRRKYEKHSVATSFYVNNSDGTEVDYIEHCVYSGDFTEDESILNTVISDAMKSMDIIEQFILDKKIAGYTDREIGTMQGISGPAVNKRMKKIRGKLIAAGL